jgi:hypothetical protein
MLLKEPAAATASGEGGEGTEDRTGSARVLRPLERARENRNADEFMGRGSAHRVIRAPMPVTV